MAYKNNIIEQRQKELRLLEKERWTLWLAMRNLGSIKLDKPLRHGYYTHLILRDDISRRKDAKVFQEIIEKCRVNIWGTNKTHADKCWNGYNTRNSQIQWPGFYKLDEKRFDKLSNKAKRHFEKIPHQPNHATRYYCNVPRWYFVKTFTKAYITHRQIIDPKLNRRLDEIDEKLRNSKYYNLSHTDYNAMSKWERVVLHQQNRSKTSQLLSNYVLSNEEAIEFVYKRNK